MIDQLVHIDQQWFLWLNNLGSESFDGLWSLITSKYTWIPFYIFLVILVFRKFDVKSALLIILGAIACVALADMISVHAFKNVFERLRPCYEPEIKEMVRVVKGCGGRYGFVSSHASNSFAIAIYFFLIFRKAFSLKWVLLLPFWAAVVAYSRIYVGVHYPLDILCGGLLGASIGLTIFKGVQRFRLIR